MNYQLLLLREVCEKKLRANILQRLNSSPVHLRVKLTDIYDDYTPCIREVTEHAEAFFNQKTYIYPKRFYQRAHADSINYGLSTIAHNAQWRDFDHYKV